MRTLALLIVLVLPVSPAVAQEVWVDPVQGSNAASGLSASDPFATITYALEQLQVAPHVSGRVVHLLPGTYSLASGETFPLVFRKGTRLVGEGGPQVTRIEYDPPLSTGNSSLIRVAPQGNAATFVLEGVELVGSPNPANGFTYMRAVGWLGGVGVDNQAVRAENCRFRTLLDCLSGKRIEAVGCEFRLEGFSVPLNSRGAFLTGQGTAASTAYLEDCLFLGMSEAVVGSTLNPAQPIRMEAELVRCRVLGCGGAAALHLTGATHPDSSLTVTDCLIADSREADVGLGQGTLTLEGSTFIGDQGSQSALVQPLSQASLDARACISTGHGTADTFGPVSAYEACFIGTPVAPLVNGSITGPFPGFVDAANGNYRLRFGSVCVDAGGPPSGTPDLAGRPRRADGDLDASARADIGAYELYALAGPASAPVGGALALELNGPAGAPYALWFSRTGLVPGQPTPFGRRFLPSTASRIAQGSYPAGPEVVSFSVPPLPALSGSAFGFQVLTTDPSLPLGGAWTQPATVLIE